LKYVTYNRAGWILYSSVNNFHASSHASRCKISTYRTLSTTYLPHFEVVPERPISKHFEERVVVAVAADNIQIVVFTAHSYALLRIRHSFVRRFLRAQENPFELDFFLRLRCATDREFYLIHAGVNESHCRVAKGNDGARFDKVVTVFVDEVVEEFLTDRPTCLVFVHIFAEFSGV
jgi:hypothetical protein